MITVLCFDQGEEIPEKYLRMLFWSPNLGAMLLSGIFPSSPKRSHPFDNEIFDPVALLPPYDPIDFQAFQIDSWRAKKYQYILDRWLQAHYNNNRPVPPRTFLSWFEENPIPILDFHGQPIAAPILTPPSESTSAPPNTRKHEVGRRQDPLSLLIEQCKREVSDPQNYQLIWGKLIDKSKQPALYPPLLGYAKEEGIKYECEDAEEGVMFLTKNALRKRLNPAARGKKKT